MDWWLILIFTLAGLLFLLALGLPVAIAFLTVNIIGLIVLMGPRAITLLTTSMSDSVRSITYAAVPMFYFLGEIIFRSKAIDLVFDAIDNLIGKIRARLNIAAILMGTALGMLSGSAIADSAILGSTLLPEMINRGYDKKLSCGSIMCAGSLAAIIPPSILAVVTGGLANVSIAKLLLAGVGPGLLLAVIFIIYVFIRVKINPGLAPLYAVPDVTMKKKLRSIFRVLPFLLIILIIFGSILSGVATPSESSAVGALGALILTACYKKLNFKVLKETIIGTMTLTAMILFIIAGSKAFSQLIALTGASRGLLDTVSNIHASPMVMLVIMLAIPFLLGCFLDQVSIIMIAVPIYSPILSIFNFEPIWFWIIFLVLNTVGAITPPFGLIIFALKGVAPDIDIIDIYRGALPFVFLTILGIAIIVAFPSIALWLPNFIQ